MAAPLPKSPFYVIEEFISPKLCEQLIDNLNLTVPDQDPEGNWLPGTRTSEHNTDIIYERLLPIFPKLEQHYQIKYKGTESITFEWFPEGTKGRLTCENSVLNKGKWYRTRARDLTGILFLCDYQDQIPFEKDFEVYGGKFEFIQHGFGFNPQRGTLIFFPSDPHFVNITTTCYAGDLFQARIQITSKSPYIYMPGQFPGTYKDWFAPMLGYQKFPPLRPQR